MVEIVCPQCRQIVLPKTRSCDYCGADLAAEIEYAEIAKGETNPVGNDEPLSPEILVPRIGEYMLEQGVLQPEGLQRALDYQQELANKGESILLGQAMLALGLVSRETLDQVVTMQILLLQNALKEANQNLQARVEERTRELQQALEQLAELNHLKSNFIANISHELRTPLTHIKGYLDILVDGGLGPLNEDQSEALEVIKRSEGRLEQLIDDLIQFSLSSRGELTISAHPTDLAQLIKITTDRVRQKIRDKEIDLQTDIDENLPMVNADVDKIGWVLMQLLDNALKFTPNGGNVKIEARGNKSTVSVAVMDTGIGIPDERIDEIFEPFHQLDSSATRRYSGTGLGLAMAYRIVNDHGSKIVVESVENKGSRFQFHLPITTKNNAFTLEPK